MAKPRVFISSTFYDLRHIRSSIENFVESLGFEPVLSEKGSITFNPDLPLDESCYREAECCDIFVLIMGGRYGSHSSIDKKGGSKDFFDRYKSITKMEYEAANKKDIPIYILVEKSVYSEYDTFKNNRDNDSIKYAHVDSINIFYLIEKILNQPRNNPVHTFEKHQEIEVWLKEQWAGLFRDLLLKRSEKNQLASLSKQVNQLSEINQTLKRYLEEVVSKVSEENAEKIITEEEQRLKERQRDKEFEECGIVREIMLTPFRGKLNTIQEVRKLFVEANTLYPIAKRYNGGGGRYETEILLDEWNNESMLKYVNEPRIILGLPPLKLDYQH